MNYDFKQFFEDNNIPKKVTYHESEKSTYKDTDVPIQYIRTAAELPNGKDWMCCSANLAKQLVQTKGLKARAQKLVTISQVQREGDLIGLIRKDTNPGVEVDLW